MIKVTLRGLKEATQAMQQYKAQFEQFRRVRVFVGSNLKYAFGIETGKHKGGRLARRAGGAFMLRDALTAVQPEIADVLQGAMRNLADFGTALYRIGLRVQHLAMGQTPVRTGSLRRSMHTVREGG